MLRPHHSVDSDHRSANWGHSELGAQSGRKNQPACVFVSFLLFLVFFIKTYCFCLLWPPYVIGHAIIFSPVVFSMYLSIGLYLSSSSFPRLISAVADWMSTILLYTWCGPSANLERRSEMCCTRLTGNAGPKNRQKFAVCAESHNSVGLYLRNEGTYRQSENTF